MLGSDETLRNFDKRTKSFWSPDTCQENVAEFYNEMKDVYDKFKGRYVGGATLCKYMKHFIKDRSDLKIIDVGAGSGWFAIELRKILEKAECLDALEPSTGMLGKAQKAGLYNKVYVEFMKGLNSTSIGDDAYDLVCCAGVFIPGHIPLEGLYEVTRIARPGGLIGIIMREYYLNEYVGFKDWYKTLEALETDGKLKKLLVVHNVPYHDEFRGVVFIYQKL